MHKSTIEILMLEDDPAEAGLVLEMLAEFRKPEFSVRQVRYLAEGLSLLRSRDFDVIMVDLGLPDSSGLETVLAVRNLARSTPIIVMTVLDDEDLALRALQLDIQDYLIKGEITGTLLKRSINYALQRKHDSEALRLSEARFRALYDDNPAMIFTIDAQGRILSANPACTDHLGYAPEELAGQPVLSIFHEEDRPAVAEQLRLCLEKPRRVCRWQLRKVRKQGGVLWVDELAQAVYDLSGSLNVLVVCQDVTERKRAGEEIERLNAQLASRAVELEEANRELEAFNYTVAHDLRKPLNVVSSYCQAMRELCAGQLPEDCAGFLDETYGATIRMNRLIDTLLDFSQRSHAEPVMERCDLSSLAHDIAAELRLAEPERCVTFRIAEGMTAKADPGLLRVVLANLFGNAWKFTAAREEAAIEFGETVVGGVPAFFVRDNGQGFDPIKAVDIFAPFRRYGGSAAVGGLGIGLATVERIIKRHGGKAWAEGRPGVGAVFFFTLGHAGVNAS